MFLRLPTSPSNFQSRPTIAYVTQQLHKSPKNYLRRSKITLRHTQLTEYLYCLGFNLMTPLFVMNNVKVTPERVLFYIYIYISLLKILMVFVSLFRLVATGACLSFCSSLSCSFPAYRVSVLIS